MFDYSEIPTGYYDHILDGPDGIRKFWHWHKFDSISRVLKEVAPNSLLDIGSFAGSFVGRFVPDNIHSLGVDILEQQILYSNKKFSTPLKRFLKIDNFSDLANLEKQFDFVTIIEVIEHLNVDEIVEIFKNLDVITRKGSSVIITTPNYLSV